MSDSSVLLQPDHVRTLAEATVKHIEEERVRRRAAVVERVRRGWWDRLRARFGRPRSDEEILADARAAMRGIGLAAFCADVYGHETLMRARRLLLLCRTGQPINVGVKDWEAIQP